MKSLLCLEAFPPQIVKISLDNGKKEIFRKITTGIPDGIWIDNSAQKVYWTVMGKMTASPEQFTAKDGSIECCNLDRSGYTTLIGNGKVTTPKQIIGDPKTKRLYWCDREGMAVMSARTDGSDFRVLIQHEKDTSIDELEKHCVGITLDPKREFLYWTQKGPPKGGKGKIFRIKLQQFLEQQSLHTNHRDIELLINHLPEPIDLEFGSKTGKLYWTDRGAPPYGNSLNCAIISDSGKLIDHHIITNGLQEGIGITIDEDENTAYTADLGGYIRKIVLADGSTEIIQQQGPTTGIILINE